MSFLVQQFLMKQRAVSSANNLASLIFGSDAFESALATVCMPWSSVFFQLLAVLCSSALFFLSLSLHVCLNVHVSLSLCSLFACLLIPPDGECVTGEKKQSNKNNLNGPNQKQIKKKKILFVFSSDWNFPCVPFSRPLFSLAAYPSDTVLIHSEEGYIVKVKKQKTECQLIFCLNHFKIYCTLTEMSSL